MARRSIEQSLAQLEAQRSARKTRLSKPVRANDLEFTDRLDDCLCRELPDFLTRDSDKVLLADLFNAKDASEPVGNSPSAKEPA
ncbi:hypothetical protein [Sinorhizobium sp. GL28]|uniref:hypothetical protein n=1 Tax=Sinorhizobium sp. GL28 TaxID=1358418 RepID=UPI00071DE7E2|nr:hypothetical protein [Sinorhizobium sp. GL28]